MIVRTAVHLEFSNILGAQQVNDSIVHVLADFLFKVFELNALVKPKCSKNDPKTVPYWAITSFSFSESSTLANCDKYKTIKRSFTFELSIFSKTSGSARGMEWKKSVKRRPVAAFGFFLPSITSL